MGEHYDHATLEDRCAIARLHEGGQSIRQIAAALDRSPSTVSRELKRNHGAQVGYKPAYAQEQARARRWKGSRLERDDDLRSLVLGCLERGWSPEQVAGWLGRQTAATTISHESIYRFIYAQIRRTQDGAWRRYLPRAKFKRGWRGRKGGSPAGYVVRPIPPQFNIAFDEPDLQFEADERTGSTGSPGGGHVIYIALRHTRTARFAQLTFWDPPAPRM
jgi:IS30 family transposase